MFTDYWENGLRTATLSSDLTGDIESAVSQTIERARAFLSTADESHPRLESLIQSLRISARRISKMEGPVNELRLIFGLTSRFCFESQGYINYHAKYLPRLASNSLPEVDTDVIGVWTKDEAVCVRYQRMGIPVWLLRHGSAVPHSLEHFIKYAEPRIYQDRPRCPENCFRDDGYVEGFRPLFCERQSDTSALMKEIDSWAKEKLGEGHQ